MTARRSNYEPGRDFIRIRGFLNQTYAAFPGPYNWGLERWNYARYFVAPMIGAYGKELDAADEASLKAIALWEDLVRVWEDEDGNIVGVTCIEHPDPSDRQYGEIFVLRCPDHVDLLEEMIVFGETHYANPQMKRVFMWAYNDDSDLISVLKARGFERKDEPVSHHLKYAFGDLPELDLPEGFKLLSIAEENDIEKRREIFGRGFNHDDPKEWPSAFSYRELQKAPDYRKEHDLFIVAPDGTYVACCIVWYDEVNRVGHLEPLGTHPNYRRMGLPSRSNSRHAPSTSTRCYAHADDRWIRAVLSSHRVCGTANAASLDQAVLNPTCGVAQATAPFGPTSRDPLNLIACN